MLRERIADDIYVFTSRRYAQVTCAAILTKDGVVLIDTLYFPDEARAVRDFLVNRLGQRVQYVINTHYHADHTTNTCLYPRAHVISHALTRQLLDSSGREGLSETKQQSAEFASTEIVLPSLTVARGTFDMTVGGKDIRLIHTPGHSPDILMVHVITDDILFASDNMMPVPTLFDGEFAALEKALRRIDAIAPECVVQGHGEVILRGEVSSAVQDNIDYMHKIQEIVEVTRRAGDPRESLLSVDIESCGKSRIPLNGFVTELHTANLLALYDRLAENPAAPGSADGTTTAAVAAEAAAPAEA